jgi:hypothetical protein
MATLAHRSKVFAAVLMHCNVQIGHLELTLQRVRHRSLALVAVSGLAPRVDGQLWLLFLLLHFSQRLADGRKLRVASLSWMEMLISRIFVASS